MNARPLTFWNIRHVLVAIAIALSAVTPTQGVAMSMFGEKQKVIVASPLEGVITHNGKPATGAKVERILRWKDEDGETLTVNVDSQGRFALPLREDEVKISPLSRYVVHQKVTVHYQGKQIPIWSLGTAHRELYGELGKKPENFRCELTDEPWTEEFEDGLLYTLCKWD